MGYKYLRIFCVFVYHKNFKDASILASLILCQIKASFNGKAHAFDGVNKTKNIYTGKEHLHNPNGTSKGWSRKNTDPWSRTRDVDYGNVNNSDKEQQSSFGRPSTGWGANRYSNTGEYGYYGDRKN